MCFFRCFFDLTFINLSLRLQATDSMMADIDDMIADFTSQLDSMFDDM